MPKRKGLEDAIKLSINKLNNIDFFERCSLLSLPLPDNKEITFRAFGRDIILNIVDLSLTNKSNKKELELKQQLIIFHYFNYAFPVIETNKLISFRDLKGGQFYIGPFQSRTINPFLNYIKNDEDKLKENLNRFDYERLTIGSLSAKIHIIGNIYITLIYRLGDKEFPPSMDLLFDSCIKKVFCTEDITVIAGSICSGLY